MRRRPARCWSRWGRTTGPRSTLRYVDDLPVAQVADDLGRTLHATEALLVRARSAFRTAYVARSGDA